MTAADPGAREAMRARIVETLGEHLPCYNHRGLVVGCACDGGGDEPGWHWRTWTEHLADALLGLWDGNES